MAHKPRQAAPTALLAMPYVETCLGRLFAQVAGQGTPVSFWHCLLGDSGIFHHQASALAASHRVVLVDGPSHGRSDPLRRRFTLEQCAGAWMQVLDAVGVTEPATLCGLSWGGMTAMRVALRHPKRVRALALLDTLASAHRGGDVPRFLALVAAIRLAGLPPWLVRILEPQMVSRRTRREQPGLVADLLGRARHLDREALSLAARSVLLDATGVLGSLGGVAAPTLVVVGSEDRTTPPGASRAIARAIPGARLEVLDEVGHLSSLESPERVTALLWELLGSVAAQG
jgi:3-oxoadipate enol-lactonase